MTRLVALTSALAISALGAVTLQAGPAHAAGFSFFEQGAAATGRGGAVTATAVDASAGFYNPSGLADLSGWNVLLGGTFVLPFASYESSLGVSDRILRGTFPPYLHAYYSSQGKWSAGISVFNAFGLGLEWPKTFPGTWQIQRIDLKTPTLQPTFAWRFNEMLSVGVGLTLAMGSAELQRSVPIGPYSAGSVYLGADKAFAVGAVAGVTVTPTKNFRIGVNYRSAMKYSFDNGKADFTFSDSIPAAVRTGLPADQAGSLEITTPHVISAGLAWDISDKLTLELDFAQYFWTSYSELRLKFGPPPAGGAMAPSSGCATPATPLPTGRSDVCQKKEWMDVPQFRLGVDWKATPNLSLRAGYVFDITPVPSTTLDPSLPDSTRHDFSLGLGYKFSKNFSLDFSYMLVYFTERTAPTVFSPLETAPGKYNSIAHLFALGVGLKF